MALLTACDPAVAAEPAARAHYDMSLGVDPAAHKLSVAGSVSLPPGRTGDRLLHFRISHTAGPIRWTSLTPGVRIVASRSATAAAEGATNPSATGARTIWTIRGDWKPKTALKLGFRYDVVTPKPDGFLYVGPEIAFGTGSWYPAVSAEKPTSVLEISAPSGSTISSGNSAQSKARRSRSSSRRFTTSVPGELLFAVSPPGSSSLRISRELSLTTLRKRPAHLGWTHGLRGVQKILEAEFGPLPYPKVTVIEVPDAIAEAAGFGAFAAPGAILARSQFINQPFNVAAFAHEFTHLWWGNHIGLEGKKGDFLLDEGLAQYGSMVAVDGVLGPAAGERYRRRGIPGFNESLYSALGYLKISAAGMDRPLLALEDDALSYWIAYSKGGLAWYALAEEMGRANFSQALKEAAAAHAAGYVSWDTFLGRLQRRSAHSLEPFIEAWFGTPSAPSYSLEWRQDGNVLSGRIVPEGSVKPATLELETRLPDDSPARRRIAVPPGGAEFSFPAGGARVRSLELDRYYRILRWTPELRAEAEAMSEHMRASILTRLGKKDEAEKVLLAWLERDPRDNRYDRLLLTGTSLARLAEDRGCRSCAIAHLEAALRLEPLRLEGLAQSYLTLAASAKRLGRNDLADKAARLARSSDALVEGANGADVKLGDLGI